MTEMKRLNVSIPKDLEDKLFEMRKKDEYIRCSIAELIRIVLRKGLEADD